MSSVRVFPLAEVPLPQDDTPELKRLRAFDAAGSNVRAATALGVRPAPEMVPFGIASLDELTGGVPRGALTEIVGMGSSGRTSITISLMAEITRRQEVCAVIDATDSFDPVSATSANVDLSRVLWVRCGKEAEIAREPKRNVRSIDAGAPAISSADSDTNEWRVQQAITNGCFEAGRGRREPSLSNVSPPAKNISWSIHQNYDARLRHAMTNGNNERGWHPPTVPTYMQKAPHVKEVVRRANSESMAVARAAKWNRLDQALKATDLLIQSGGFGLILVDLGDVSGDQARRIPLTSWFRFRRAVENTPTILVVVARESCAKTCASLVMQLSADAVKSGPAASTSEPYRGIPQSLTHVSLLDGLNVHAELIRTRLERKPIRSAGAEIMTETSWRKSG